MERTRKVRKPVMPVAGNGTRLLPATKAMPKEMLTIVDRPIVQYALNEAREAGIEHVVFVTSRNKQVIEANVAFALSRPDIGAAVYQSLRDLVMAHEGGVRAA